MKGEQERFSLLCVAASCYEVAFGVCETDGCEGEGFADWHNRVLVSD